MGVTSRMVVTCSPAVARARMADSRPEPGPFTRTSTVRIPTSRARLAAAPAACPAAKGVPLREPLKPTAPQLDQATTLPFTSVTVTSVLLNDAWMCTMPAGTCFFSRFLRNSFLRAGLWAVRGGAPAWGRARAAAHLDEALDVHRDFFAQVALDPALFLDSLADTGHLV